MTSKGPDHQSDDLSPTPRTHIRSRGTGDFCELSLLPFIVVVHRNPYTRGRYVST